MNTSEFILKSKNVHLSYYDYSKSEYVNTKTKVIIECPKHGLFKQYPYDHMNGRRCKKCGYEIVTKKQQYNLKKFLDKATKIHKNKYDYSKSNYVKSSQKIIITCPIHGDFKQTPNKHLLGQGCRRCGYIKISGVTKDLLKEAKKLKRAVSSIYYRKTYTDNCFISELLGCDWNTFKSHLESNSYNFKVGDINIDLDHIIPVSSAKNLEELYKLHHYTNFQLLPSYYNRYIKKDKIVDKNHFKKWYKSNKNV